MRSFKDVRHALRRRWHERLGSAKHSKPGLDGLDDKLAKYLDFDGGFFIEVGANDGFTQSNTYYLEKFKGWRGILIEAVPELFARCRRERPASRVYNCALVAQTYPEATIEINYANLMSLVVGARSTRQAEDQHVQEGMRVQELPSSYRVRVPARTLDSILSELQPQTSIDFFSLDVEGYEVAVLQGLSLERYRPRFVLVETHALADVNAVLAGHYDVVDQLTCHDYLYHRKVDR